MKTLMYKIITGLMWLVLPAGCFGQQVPTAKITVQVNDDRGDPVPGAFIGVGGGDLTPENGPVPDHRNGTTDGKGRFIAEIASAMDQYGAFARKDGYYEGEAYYYSKKDPHEEWMKRPYQTGRWEPWERTIKITLRPIKKPVPMYVKQILVDIPEEGQWVGYDLKIGDWIAPYGKGALADIELYSTKHYEDNINYAGELTFRFPGKGNGIQACDFGENSHSAYKWPYEAPEEGYQSDWKWQHARITEKTFDARSKFIDESQKKNGFIFRVRSKLDERGRVIEACYGRIPGPFIFDPRGKDNTGRTGGGFLNFTYYLNPDKTRNLEYDPTRNLFPKSKTGGGFGY